MSKPSILMPVYNEDARLADVLKAAFDVDYPSEVELVMVDDGRIDGIREILAGVADHRLVAIFQEKNSGEGAAIRTAAEHGTGDLIVILDADLKHDPADIPRLIGPVPINYHARQERKKITWWDRVEALWILVRQRFGRPVLVR